MTSCFIIHTVYSQTTLCDSSKTQNKSPLSQWLQKYKFRWFFNIYRMKRWRISRGRQSHSFEIRGSLSSVQQSSTAQQCQLLLVQLEFTSELWKLDSSRSRRPQNPFPPPRWNPPPSFSAWRCSSREPLHVRSLQIECSLSAYLRSLPNVVIKLRVEGRHVSHPNPATNRVYP